MCSQNNDKNNECLAEILEKILILQQRDNEYCEDNTCTRPFLGPSLESFCFNTRLISFYSCCNSTLWEMPYTLGGISSTSSIFRIESLNDECATFRVLVPNPDTTSSFQYLATEDFFTIRLKCIGVLRCLGDTNIAGI